VVMDDPHHVRTVLYGGLVTRSLSNRTFEHMDEDGLAKMRCVARLGRGLMHEGGRAKKSSKSEI
jgi:hypothetical protein